ncbi:Zinc finger protein 28 [Portunus trituberculatus]|uniref:Zinc finger protein 28 n=1 Tax=Portunus trituberculatus TaxID=210409 RepID=A0A5B7CK25_PORTR|nr:Zinc finger protein 28 [Portunus trituberculatus]
MENLEHIVTSGATGVTHVAAVGTVQGVAGVTGVQTLNNVSGVNTVGSVAGVTGVTGLAWYNYSPDGVGQLITSGPAVQVELGSPDIARQFNQQVQAQYGNLQVQVQAVTNPTPVTKPPPASTPDPLMIVKQPKSRVRQSGGERVPCPECGKTVSCNATLRDHLPLDKHMKVHSKSRPFKCDSCDKAFKYKESLTVHKEKYCGKEVSKKPRAPRRPDAKKPGPKPGSGRKYVQKRKGRPRGRPRKRGRGKRGRPRKYFKQEDFDEEEEDIDGELEPEEVPLDEISEDQSEEIIPEAIIDPLKIEKIVEETELQHDSLEQHADELQHHQLQHEHLQHATHEIHIEDATALTIVSPEEAEQQAAAAGGVQLVTLHPEVPIQIVSHDPQTQVTHQLITRDGVQMWYPRQYQHNIMRRKLHVSWAEIDAGAAWSPRLRAAQPNKDTHP